MPGAPSAMRLLLALNRDLESFSPLLDLELIGRIDNAASTSVPKIIATAIDVFVDVRSLLFLVPLQFLLVAPFRPVPCGSSLLS